MQISSVKRLNKSELDTIIKLHRQLLKHSFINQLGQSFTRLFYKSSLESKDNLFYLIWDQDQVVGFLLATLNNQRFISQTFFKSPFLFSWEIIKSLLTKPNQFLTLLISSLKTLSDHSEAELQLIAIDPKYQGQGLGTKLITKLTDDLKKLGHQSFIVGTEAENSRSNNFYKKLGFKPQSAKVIFGKKLNYYISS